MAFARSRLGSGQALVTDAVQLVDGGAQLLVAEGLVVGDVAREEAHLATPSREDVGPDAVQEPPIVRDHDNTPRKRLEAALQRAERVDIEIVGGSSSSRTLPPDWSSFAR